MFEEVQRWRRAVPSLFGIVWDTINVSFSDFISLPILKHSKNLGIQPLSALLGPDVLVPSPGKVTRLGSFYFSLTYI